MARKSPLISSVFCAAVLVIIAISVGCKKQNDGRIVVWTDNSEFAPYLELFNKTHQDKALLVYKENPSYSLPASRDEAHPDLVIGSWLVNEHTRHYFEALDYLFERKFISSQEFYKILLQAGKMAGRQYLLPVSFNLPAMIFSTENAEFVEDNYTINLEQVKKSGEAFNKKNANGNFSRMGFAPESNDNFLYLVTKIQGTGYRETKGNSFTWNRDVLKDSIGFLDEWITSINGSSQIERDFVYKYLSTTDDKKVTQGKALFSYTTSDRLFRFPRGQLSLIDYRWLEDQKRIPVEDSMVMMGIPRKAKNHYGAVEFISWFYNVQTQQALLERKFTMNLDINRFGIANGFSSIREVTEHILPVYYTALLSNIPQAENFRVYEKKPLRWEMTKQRVIIPYIKEVLATRGTKKISSIEERYAEWKKQGFN